MLPYRYLMPTPLVPLAIMLLMNVEVYSEGTLFEAAWRKAAAPFLIVLSLFYLASMAVRYALTIIRHPLSTRS